MVLSENARSEIRRLMAQFPQRQSALLGALFVAQDEVGYLSPDALGDVAVVMNLPMSEITSVASFYHLYRFKPEGRHVIQLCTNISCQLRGCGRILDHLRRRLQVDVGETTADGAFTLKTAEERRRFRPRPLHARVDPKRIPSSSDPAPGRAAGVHDLEVHPRARSGGAGRVPQAGGLRGASPSPGDVA